MEEFLDFVNYVNSGTNFSGSTVFLDADIDFSELSGKAIDPIGYFVSEYDFGYFLGTFDGKGHTISNLLINSESDCVGLFGYSTGMIVKDVVLDVSCSITCSYKSTSNRLYVGGIIGNCEAKTSPCTIEKCVNKGNVAFTGSNGDSGVYLGGIAGSVHGSNYVVTIKGSENYGSVVQNGKSYDSSIGGIVGSSSSSLMDRALIQDCTNYGDVTCNESLVSYELLIDGIAGSSQSTEIENCKNKGKITPSSASGLSLTLAGILFLALMI